VACSNFPKCRYIKKEQKEVEQTNTLCSCPKCDGNIIVRKTRRGKEFYGCSNYPKCDYATWYKPTGEVCSKCGNLIVTKNNGNICESCDK